MVGPDVCGGYLSWTAGRTFVPSARTALKSPRIETQGLEDGGRHLGGAYIGADGLGLEGRIGQQQNDIRVVMGEPAVLRQFLVLPE